MSNYEELMGLILTIYKSLFNSEFSCVSKVVLEAAVFYKIKGLTSKEHIMSWETF